MVIHQGDVWWVNLREPVGSEPAYRHPVIVVQCDDFNRTSINTIVCVAVTSNTNLVDKPGNVPLSNEDTGLPEDSVANVSHLFTLDRSVLKERVGTLPSDVLEEVLDGIEMVLGRLE